jgi:histidinol-phosphatase (PHP family)
VRLPDYHTHSVRCGHACGTPAEYVAAAQAAGLLAIGVADHLPLLPHHDPELSMEACELDDYVAEVRELKERFPGFVLLGIEADYRPGTVDEVRSLLGSQPFDYVIGSVHHLDDWGFDDPRQIHRYDSVDIDDLWVDYFELVGEAAESGMFTIMGHLDLVKKFGYRASRSLDAELDRLLMRIARAGVAVEINTAGLHKPVKEAYPSPEILRKLRVAGIPITFGSDAHRPEEVGRDFAHAADLAAAAGYESFMALDAEPAGGWARPRTVRFAAADGEPAGEAAPAAARGRPASRGPGSADEAGPEAAAQAGAEAGRP